MPNANHTSNHAPTTTLPPPEYLRQCFDYEPETGVLRWRKRPLTHFADARVWASWNTKFEGTSAGCITPRGHILVGINRHTYRLHRVIWKLVTGQEPPPELDHKDGNPSNNRLDNLRYATRSQQMWNMELPKSSTGHRGAYQHGERFVAKITHYNRRYHIGVFDTAEEASAAYEAAARDLRGEFYRKPK